MAIFDDYFTGNCSIALEKVNYEKLGEIDGDVTLGIKDAFEFKETTDNSDSVEFIVSRTLSFEPKSLVDITVSFSISLELEEKYKGSKELDYDLIKEEMLNQESTITAIVMSRISLLVSQLTSSYGERPIVTPPSLITEE